jgi:Flp pilus assembly protein TadG
MRISVVGISQSRSLVAPEWRSAEDLAGPFRGPGFLRKEGPQAAPRSARSSGRRRGAAAVELAILAPLLLFLFVIGVDFARVFYFAVTVDNCARDGAVYGSADPTHALDQSSINGVAMADAPNLDPQLMTYSSTTDSGTNPTYVQVTVTYQFDTITNYPGVPHTMTLTRTVWVPVAPLVPKFN